MSFRNSWDAAAKCGAPFHASFLTPDLRNHPQVKAALEKMIDWLDSAPGALFVRSGMKPHKEEFGELRDILNARFAKHKHSLHEENRAAIQDLLADIDKLITNLGPATDMSRNIQSMLIMSMFQVENLLEVLINGKD